jgi:hypothetical protein
MSGSFEATAFYAGGFDTGGLLVTGGGAGRRERIVDIYYDDDELAQGVVEESPDPIGLPQQPARVKQRAPEPPREQPSRWQPPAPDVGDARKWISDAVDAERLRQEAAREAAREAAERDDEEALAVLARWV